jgi:uncharacterized membrane protein
VDAFINWWAANVPFGPHLSVFILSMIPGVEERGGLILAKMLDLPMWEAVFFCVIGNIIPIPFVLFGTEKAIQWLSYHHLSSAAAWLTNKALKNQPKIEKYGFWGLMLFVGIPLPGTGAWTGSIVASVFNMEPKRASASILLGVFLAAVIMTLISYGFLEIFI